MNLNLLFYLLLKSLLEVSFNLLSPFAAISFYFDVIINYPCVAILLFPEGDDIAFEGVDDSERLYAADAVGL